MKFPDSIDGAPPSQGRDYDYSSDSIRCYADRMGARVFVLEKTEWRKSVRVLALDLEDARSCADRLLPPWRLAPEDGPFGREISNRIKALGDDVLSGAQQRRLAQILARAAREAVGKTNGSSFGRYWDYKKHLETALFKAVRKHCRLLVDAAATSDAKGNAYQEAETIRVKARVKAAILGKEIRRKLAAELRTSRTTLKKIRRDIAALLPVANADCLAHKYNEVPGPVVEASRFGEGVPSCSGIYFVWNDGRVVYVGKSSRLAGRCTLAHHAIAEGDWLSWVEFPLTMLNFAECFYIGALKPIRNFGLDAVR
jgi:hypothetical protein